MKKEHHQNDEEGDEYFGVACCFHFVRQLKFEEHCEGKDERCEYAQGEDVHSICKC